MTRLIATGLVSLAFLVAGLVVAPVAGAAHHLVRINEVFPGLAAADADAEYIELKLTSAGENLVTGTSVRIFGAAGAESTPAPTFSSNPGMGQNQQTILVGTPDAEVLFLDKQMDLEYANADRIDPSGGAVCFDSPSFAGVDCVSWGSFPPAIILPDGSGSTPHGTPEPGPVPAGSSLQRSMDPNCPTLLELGDDTNDSATDFSYVDPQTPRNSADAPEGAACTTLTLNRTGTGTGDLTGNVGTTSIICPPTCTYSNIPATDTADFIATPAAGSTFGGYTGCPMMSGMNGCTALMNVNRTITANFVGPPGGGGGSMTPATPILPPSTPAPPKKCKKGFVKRKGKCKKKTKKKGK